MIHQVYKVLLVEDVPLIAKITEQMLKKSPIHAYVSTHTMTLAASVAALKSDNFDVILLDLNLPDSSDLATLTSIVAVAPEVPIVVLTATNSDEIGLRAVQMSAQDFLLKGDFNYVTLDRAIIYAIERHRLQRTIRQLAVLDELTGLYNRRGFNTLYPDVMQRVKRSDSRGYLCFFDLDRFKQINDELGHARGDDALKEFAATLGNVFRKDALLVRLGGDEFVAMGVEQQNGQIDTTLLALANVLADRNSSGKSGFTLAASVGVIHFDKTGPDSLEELTALADAELYKNKELRRAARKQAGGQLEPHEERR